MATTSDRMLKAFDFAFEQVGYQVANMNIEIITGDSKGDPATAVEVAKRMVEQDHVAMIVGPTQGGEEMGVACYCGQVGIPVLFTNPAPADATGPGFPMAVLGYGSEPMYSTCMADYAYKTLGYRNVDVLAGDFTPGHGFLGAFAATFTKLGGTIEQEIFTPYPSQDFSSYLTSLKDCGCSGGLDRRPAGHPATHPVSSSWAWTSACLWSGPSTVPSWLRSSCPRCRPTWRTPWWATSSPCRTARCWTTLSTRSSWPTSKPSSGYCPRTWTPVRTSAPKIILHALEATNGDTTPATLLDALVAVNFEGPEGLISFDPATRCAVKTIYIAKVAKQDDGAFVWDPIFTYTDVPAGWSVDRWDKQDARHRKEDDKERWPTRLVKTA